MPENDTLFNICYYQLLFTPVHRWPESSAWRMTGKMKQILSHFQYTKFLATKIKNKLSFARVDQLHDIIGYVDVFGPELVGWGLDKSSPSQVIIICIDVDDRLVKKIRADGERPDITSRFLTGRHGFSVDISQFLSPGPNKVKVYSEGHSEPLPRGSGIIDLQPRSHQVAMGHGGWLYLQNDSNEVRSILQRSVDPDDESITRFLRQALYRASVIKSCGAEYLHLIVPEKHVVYEQYLPAGWSISPNRKAAILARQGRTQNLRVHYLDDDLIRASRDGQSYYKNDTHWCWHGRRTMLNYVKATFGLAAAQDCDWIYEQNEIPGDLGSKLDRHPPEIIEELVPDIAWSETHIDRVDDAVINHNKITGSYVYMKRDIKYGLGPKLLLIGTSSCYNCCGGFLEIYQEILFMFDLRLDIDIFRQFQATHVIFMTTERYLNPMEDDFGCKYALDHEVVEALKASADSRPSRRGNDVPC